MEYLQLYCWPNYQDRDRRAREFFDKAKAGIETLKLPADCAFCLISNTWTFAGETHTHMMVLVLVESETLPEAYRGKVEVPEAEGAPSLSPDQIAAMAAIAGLRAQGTFVTEVQKELKAYFRSCGCPEEQETESVDLGPGITSVDNLAKRIESPTHREDFKVIAGPVIKRVIPRIKSQNFKGESVEEAKAAAAAAIPSDKIVKMDVSQDVLEGIAEGEGDSADAAIQAAKVRLRGHPEAFDVSPVEIVLEGQKGTVEVQAYSEMEVADIWRTSAPEEARLESTECVLAPAKGFLGIGKRRGSWRVHWSIPFKARASFRWPAVVTVQYYGDAIELGKT